MKKNDFVRGFIPVPQADVAAESPIRKFFWAAEYTDGCMNEKVVLGGAKKVFHAFATEAERDDFVAAISVPFNAPGERWSVNLDEAFDIYQLTQYVNRAKYLERTPPNEREPKDLADHKPEDYVVIH